MPFSLLMIRRHFRRYATYRYAIHDVVVGDSSRLSLDAAMLYSAIHMICHADMPLFSLCQLLLLMFIASAIGFSLTTYAMLLRCRCCCRLFDAAFIIAYHESSLFSFAFADYA